MIKILGNNHPSKKIFKKRANRFLKKSGDSIISLLRRMLLTNCNPTMHRRRGHWTVNYAVIQSFKGPFFHSLALKLWEYFRSLLVDFNQSFNLQNNVYKVIVHCHILVSNNAITLDSVKKTNKKTLY